MPSPPAGGQPGGQTPGTPPPPGGSPQSSGDSSDGTPGADGLPGGDQPTGDRLPGSDGTGQAPRPGEQAGWEPASGGAAGGADGESGAPPGGTGDESWEQGAADGDDGWATSNQIPGTAPIPPMPSERGKPPGSGADGELDGALEDFDGEILSEREVIRSRTNETAGAGGLPPAGDADTTGSAGGDASAQDGTTGTADIPMPRGGMGVPSSRREPPAPRPAGDVAVPDDIPNARDDDIIARQLREAAMQESDPELKEKLWDEYRRYKGI
jgi:hypothetical protein